MSIGTQHLYYEETLREQINMWRLKVLMLNIFTYF